MQAIASRLCYILKYDSLSESDVQAIGESVIAFVSPMMEEMAWLSREISASHVLRSFLCILVGIPTVAEKKVSFLSHFNVSNTIKYGEMYLQETIKTNQLHLDGLVADIPMLTLSLLDGMILCLSYLYISLPHQPNH